MHAQGTSNAYTANILTYADNSNQPRLFEFTQGPAGKKTYINGVLVATSNDTTKLSRIGTLAIGKSYNGELAEMIAFNRVLDDLETAEVTKYLAKKWNAINYTGLAASGATSTPTDGISCTTGVLTPTGCDTSICSVSVTGSSTTKVATGSGSINCNRSGYAGTLSYNCADGSFAPSPSDAVCACDGTHHLVAGSCLPDCSVSGITGINNTSVNAGTGTLTCDKSNFTGSISYTCTDGTLTPSGSCSCASGYELVSGACQVITCSFSGTTGIANGTSVAYASSPTGRSCDAGYSGTVNYTCTATGVPTITSGSCTAITCSFSGTTGIANGTSVAYATSPTARSCNVSGYTGTVNYTCTATGAPTITSGSCTAITCSFSGTTGITNGTTVAYAASPTARSCNVSGYTGTVNYTCTAIGAPTITSGSCSIAGHWVSIGGVYATETSGGGCVAGVHSFTCNSSNNNRYITTNAGGGVSTSNNVATSGADIYGWMDCYCTSYNCLGSLSCGYPGVSCTTSGTSPYTIYKCVYP